MHMIKENQTLFGIVTNIYSDTLELWHIPKGRMLKWRAKPPSSMKLCLCVLSVRQVATHPRF